MNDSQNIFGEPKGGSRNKVRGFMVPWVIEFIQNSPFLVMSSSNENGECDASPKGGKPGFVKVLDEKTLIIPDVAGNKLFQSYENFESNPKVGLMFVIPAITSVARVNGTIEILREGNEVFSSLALDVFSPDENSKLLQAIRVSVTESYSHCPRAMGFSKLWDTDVIRQNEKTSPISKWKPGT
ncbi:MAG: pyridoxamine 5'-phosphate oxidase family protein [Halioglobus sp.]